MQRGGRSLRMLIQTSGLVGFGPLAMMVKEGHANCSLILVTWPFEDVYASPFLSLFLRVTRCLL